MDHRSIKRPRSESIGTTEVTKEPGKKKKKVKGNKPKDAAEKKKDGKSTSTTGTSDLPLLEMYVCLIKLFDGSMDQWFDGSINHSQMNRSLANRYKQPSLNNLETHTTVPISNTISLFLFQCLFRILFQFNPTELPQPKDKP